MGKRVQTYYLPDALLEALQVFGFTAAGDVNIAKQLGFSAAADTTPATDTRGLTEENYAYLRTLLNCKATGDDLVAFGLKNRTTARAVTSYVAKSQKANAQRKMPATVSGSRLVEALLRFAMEKLEKDAATKSGSRKAGGSRKAA